MTEVTLLIFMRNLVHGRVKTRIAATLGNDAALRVYQMLLDHTASVTHDVAATRIVCYSEFIEHDGPWDDSCFRVIQKGNDLGERMSAAFKDTLRLGSHKVILIGTDCYELNADILTLAFAQLTDHDIVFGPALDGGYYLLGMKNYYPQLFENIAWSTEKVLEQTIRRCDDSELSYSLLPTLNDIDDELDLKKSELWGKL